MSTEVVYARVPTSVKEAVQDYADTRGGTMAAAVSELLSLGLDAAHNGRSIQNLQERVMALEGEVAQAKAEAYHEGLRRQAAEQQAVVLQGAMKAWSDRAEQSVGECPNSACGKSVRGFDLLVSGTCPACKQAVGSMLKPEAKPDRGVNWDQLLPILIAGGVVLGAVAATRGRI